MFMSLNFESFFVLNLSFDFADYLLFAIQTKKLTFYLVVMSNEYLILFQRHFTSRLIYNCKLFTSYFVQLENTKMCNFLNKTICGRLDLMLAVIVLQILLPFMQIKTNLQIIDCHIFESIKGNNKY